MPNNTAQHETQRYLDVVRAMGIDGTNDEPEVFVDNAGSAWVSNFLEIRGLMTTSPSSVSTPEPLLLTAAGMQ